MPLFYCKPRWIKAEGTSTGNSLFPNSSRIWRIISQKCAYLNSIAPDHRGVLRGVAGHCRLFGAAVQLALQRRRLLADRMGIEALPVGLQMRNWSQLAALGQQIHQEGVQDVGAGEAIGHQVVAACQHLIEVAQHLGTLWLWRSPAGSASGCHPCARTYRAAAAEYRSLGEVEPLQVFGIPIASGWASCPGSVAGRSGIQ